MRRRSIHRDHWTISRHSMRGRWLRWHPTEVYTWTNSRERAARFGTYTEALRAAEALNMKDRFEIGRI